MQNVPENYETAKENHLSMVKKAVRNAGFSYSTTQTGSRNGFYAPNNPSLHVIGISDSQASKLLLLRDQFRYRHGVNHLQVRVPTLYYKIQVSYWNQHVRISLLADFGLSRINRKRVSTFSCGNHHVIANVLVSITLQ